MASVSNFVAEYFLSMIENILEKQSVERIYNPRLYLCLSLFYSLWLFSINIGVIFKTSFLLLEI